MVVPKNPDQDGKVKYGVYVDLRKLNQITIEDACPLPNITDIFDQLGKSKYYNNLDLAQTYKIKIHTNHCENIAFSKDKEHSEFTCIPFNLKGHFSV